MAPPSGPDKKAMTPPTGAVLGRARNSAASTDPLPRPILGSASMSSLRGSPSPALAQTSGASAAVLAQIEAAAPKNLAIDRLRSRTIQVGNLHNEHALRERMATLAMISEAMDDDALRRWRYSSATMGDGISKDKSFGALSTLATFEEELYLDDLQVLRPLGYGAFSTVELVRVPKSHPLSALSPQGTFAVKRINVPTAAQPYVSGGNAPLLPPSEVSAFDGISMMAEGALMKNLHHPNILTCYGAIGRRAAAHEERDGKTAVRRSALILDYAPGGTLRQRIDMQDYPPKIAVEWLLGVARGVAYLHELHGISVAHRDLKPSNILLGADGQPKIADLGLFRLMKGPAVSAPAEGGSGGSSGLGGRRGSEPPPEGEAKPAAKPKWRFFAPRLPKPKPAPTPPPARKAAGARPAPARMTGRTGTVVYMAPENWRAKSAYTQKVDIYSFGIIAWEVLSQTIAYDDLEAEPETIGEWVAERGLRPFVPPQWPEPLASLVKRCWGTDPEARPSAREVVDCLEEFAAAAGKDKRLYEALAVQPRTSETVLTAFNQAPTTESWVKSLSLSLPSGRRRQNTVPEVQLPAGAL